MIEPIYDRDGITIYNADCLDVLPIIEADVLISDPDYGVGINYTKRASGINANEVDGPGSLKAEDADALLAAMLNSVRVRKPSGLLFWSGSVARLDAFKSTVEMSGWRRHHMGIWYKPNGAGPSGNGLARRFEPWFWVVQGDGKPQRDGEWGFLPDCIDISRVVPGHNEACDHPTQKPLELMRRLMLFFTKPDDIVLDPFMGSGTTLRAAKDLGRRAIGIELNRDYCDIAIQRMSQGVLL